MKRDTQPRARGALRRLIPFAAVLTLTLTVCWFGMDRASALYILTDEEGVRHEMEAPVNAMIKKVSEDYERMKYNTAIAAMMSYVNEIYTRGSLTRGELRALLLCLNPVSPHVTEEMWEICGFGEPIYKQSWPTYDETKLVADEVEIAVQIKGKVRGRIMVPASLGKDDGEKLLENETVKKLVGDAQVKKIIFVPGRLLNIVC